MKEKKGLELLPVPATVVGARQLTEKEKLLTVRTDDGRGFNYTPGQFVMVSLYGLGEAPISIASSPLESQDTFEMCIRSVGNLTGAIHRLKQGEKLGIRGPYGNGFPMERFAGRDVVIVAGGLGLAPLRSLIESLRIEHRSYGRIIVLIGSRRPESFFFLDSMNEWENDETLEVHITVDVATPGWDGHVGVITTLFKHLTIDPLNTVAVVVGPPVMYGFVISEFLKMGIFENNIFLSLERRMRCGVGKCGHCQINGIYLCRDGPVLTYKEARKLQEAL